MNFLHPPFNDVRARRAVLMALNQEDYMRAFLDDDSLWKPLLGVLTPGTPLYNEEGGEILKGPRDLKAAKRLLKEAGYAGQPVTCLVAQDLPYLKAWGDVTADLLKRLGIDDPAARPAPGRRDRDLTLGLWLSGIYAAVVVGFVGIKFLCFAVRLAARLAGKVDCVRRCFNCGIKCTMSGSAWKARSSIQVASARRW